MIVYKFKIITLEIPLETYKTYIINNAVDIISKLVGIVDNEIGLLN